MPTTGQLVLLGVAILLYAVGAGVSLLRLRNDSAALRASAKLGLVGGTLLTVMVLVWHSWARGQWLPLVDNFDALLWLAVLLALFVLYVQRTRPLAGLEWFIMPVVMVLLIAATLVGRWEYHEYVDTLWSWVHRITSYAGALVFAVAGATGAMYLIARARLRRKSPSHGPKMGSLERLEHMTYVSVTLGFALLTLGAVTGFAIMYDEGRQTPVLKLLLVAGVWLIYAVVLHAPINPVFRGRRAALLSVFGFLLMVGVIVAVQVG
jgi:ABC-type uncharacterized transport system permease subunit